jgi:hypothetical protein
VPSARNVTLRRNAPQKPASFPDDAKNKYKNQ